MQREQIIPVQLQNKVTYINSKELILAQILLPQIADLPDYDQYMRVQDINIALSQGHLKVIPCRVLVHKTNGSELKLNLPVPDWTKSATDVTSILDDNGQRIMIPATYSQYVTPEPTEEVPEPEPVLEVVETKDEPVLVNTLKYLITVIENKKFIEAMEMFTQQFVDDEILLNPNAFKTLD